MGKMYYVNMRGCVAVEKAVCVEIPWIVDVAEGELQPPCAMLYTAFPGGGGERELALIFS